MIYLFTILPMPWAQASSYIVLPSKLGMSHPGANAKDPTEVVTAMGAELETQLTDLEVNESIGANVD